MVLRRSFLLPFLWGMLVLGFTSCENEITEDVSEGKVAYILKKEDIKICYPEGGLETIVDNLFKIEVESVSDENVVYKWFLGEEEISRSKSLEYIFENVGEYKLKLCVSQGDIVFEYEFTVNVVFDELPEIPEGATPYITKVFDYLPAPGQFVNTMPEYEEGDTQETMNKKVLEAIGNNNRGLITLGGYGGYVTVGFDHTIENKPNSCDFNVLGNAFDNSSEPGIIMVALDVNKNGIPDDNEWYEIAGSAHRGEVEEWYTDAEKAGNDMELHKDYEMTYYRPETEPQGAFKEYICWEANKGKVTSGYKEKNQFHKQPYYPMWIKEDKITFKGTCLPQNGYDTSGQGTYYVLKSFAFGYADVHPNNDVKGYIDIDWAVDKNGNPVNLPGVDFVKIYCGVNQENGWLGECSTEITGVVDLHLLEK